MRIEEFESQLKKEFSPDLSIRPNTPPNKVVEMYPDVVKLASILYKGVEICTIPNFDIYDEPNPNYGVDLRQDGRFIKHRTRPEALEIVKSTLARISNDKEYANAFFGTGDFSDEVLMAEEPTIEVVEEVKVDVKEIKDEQKKLQ